METIHALNYSSDLLEISLEGEIHSVFKRTINIITEKNEIYTLATSDIFKGPRLIHLSPKDLSKINELVGKNVQEKSEKLVIKNQLEIDFFDAEKYKVPEIIFKPVSEKVKENVIFLNNYLIKELDTVGYYRKTFLNEVENVLHQFLITGSSLLKEGLEENNEKKVNEGIAKLVGLGHGLTPSGDDLLTGVSLVLNSSNYPNQEMTQLFNQQLTSRLSKTNLISQNQLRLSMNGKALAPTITFINALFEGKEIEELMVSMKEILTIGSSSGSDILSGVFLGMELKHK